MTGDASAGAESIAPIRREGAVSPREREQVRADRDDHHVERDGISVLLIDGSDAETQDILAALGACTDPSVTVDHVSDPKEAEHRWHQGEHDLIIVDVWLGRGISVELVTLLTKSTCTRPIVMLSSLSAEEVAAYFTDTDLFIHSKRDISPGAFSRTLETALSQTS